MSSHNRNPKGKNQHEHDEDFERQLEAALRRYHRELKTSNKEIVELLLADYSINTRGTATMKTLSEAEAEQLIVSKMSKDPPSGPVYVQFGQKSHSRITSFYHGHLFQRQCMFTTMRWSCDGHDKLYKIGFPIWSIVDDATSKILKGWVVPSNRLGEIIGYLYLCLVEEYGGVPLQTTTDCGSETTILFGIVNSLRSIFHPDLDATELPPHVYLRSVHNIAVERQWLRLRLEFGDNAVISELCQWLWPRVLQAGLDNYADFRNSCKTRKQTDKPGPSGMSRNTAFSLPHKWNGRNCLLKVDVEVIKQMKLDMGGDALLAFSTPEFAEQAQNVFDSLLLGEVTLENVWDVFTAMLFLLFPNRAFPNNYRRNSS
ncbi:hypothetical protein B0H10DRAFT_2202016 [Mycena sp. CBHHK59/15]|nr:hypothetical protein B0H10DRAFT_2202016 [Mycena sp. CBHHK59/15]